MRSGDTLVVKNGTYAESLGGGVQPPAGAAGKLTVIQAESSGGVVIDTRGQSAPLELSNSYIRVDGFKFLNGEGAVGRLSGNNIEVLRSGFGNAGAGAHDSIVAIEGNNVLLEDSWMWGRGKAGVEISTGGATLRRLVIRLDYYNGSFEHVGVLLYGAYDTLIENVIALDFGTSLTSFDWKGGFRSRDMFDTRTQRYYGTIALNLPYDGYRMSDSNYENVIAWNVGGRGGLYEDSWKKGYTVKNATVGSSKGGGINTNDSAVTNSMMYKIFGPNTGGAYNLYYEAQVPGDAVDAITTDPQLKYIPRVEPGTSADNTGAGGADRGATVTHRYQNGALTSTPLWPWPNEARIKADFQTDLGLPGINPRRGFAADGNGLRGTPITLTSYIWEYLGNSCPSDVCK
jgi:hypothetical protein